MPWTTPADIRAKVNRWWDSGRLLSATLGDEPFFPASIPLSHPGSEDLSRHFDESRRWVRELEEGAKAVRGYGYEIVFTEINNRHIGRNQLPTSVILSCVEDALRLIGKVREAARFRSLAAMTLEKIPELRDWVKAKPMKLLDHAEKWERILAVLEWLRAHPRPGIYVRQMDLPGVDTKFIESSEGILTELHQRLGGDGESSTGPGPERRKTFEARFGFLSKPALVRFRILDSRMRIQGLSDLSIPVGEMAGLSIPVKRIYITENDINGLAFPPLEASLVLFGLGYGVESLAAIPWLQGTEVIYWGDIDTHGFAILDRVRTILPHCKSLLMDRETLMAHRDFWVKEKAPARSVLPRLTAEESGLYEDLVMNRLGENLRLEQERLGFNWVTQALPV